MMRAISLWQPWASLMAIGVKTIETRGRLTHVRGELAICSALAINGMDALYGDSAIAKALFPDGYPDEGYLGALPFGKVLCVVELFGCVPSEILRANGCADMSAPKLSSMEIAAGNYDDNRYGWLTRNLRPLKEPVVVKGGQGFFFLPADVEARVRAQI